MSYKKSDILFLGVNRHASNDGNLVVSFHSKPGSSDALVLRDVLALFGAQIVTTGIGYNTTPGNTPNRDLTGYMTDLKFSELAKLNPVDSFPLMEEKRIAREKVEQERRNRIEARRLAEEEIHDRKRQAAEKEQKARHAADLVEVQARRKREEEERAKRQAEVEAKQKEREAEVNRIAAEKELELNLLSEEILQRKTTAAG